MSSAIFCEFFSYGSCSVLLFNWGFLRAYIIFLGFSVLLLCVHDFHLQFCFFTAIAFLIFKCCFLFKVVIFWVSSSDSVIFSSGVLVVLLFICSRSHLHLRIFRISFGIIAFSLFHVMFKISSLKFAYIIWRLFSFVLHCRFSSIFCSVSLSYSFMYFKKKSSLMR